MEDKYLQVKNENIFTRFVKFIKGIFISKEKKLVGTEKTQKSIEEEKNDFIDGLKISDENLEILKLQNQYEKREIELSMLSDDEIHELNSLYKKQIGDLKLQLNSRKNKLNVLRTRIANI